MFSRRALLTLCAPDYVQDENSADFTNPLLFRSDSSFAQEFGALVSPCAAQARKNRATSFLVAAEARIRQSYSACEVGDDFHWKKLPKIQHSMFSESETKAWLSFQPPEICASTAWSWRAALRSTFFWGMPQCITVVEGEIVAVVVSHSILHRQGASER